MWRKACVATDSDSDSTSVGNTGGEQVNDKRLRMLRRNLALH